MKEEILAFLKWAEKTRASALCYNDGFGSADLYLQQYELEDLVDDYIKSQEEE